MNSPPLQETALAKLDIRCRVNQALLVTLDKINSKFMKDFNGLETLKFLVGNIGKSCQDLGIVCVYHVA